VTTSTQATSTATSTARPSVSELARRRSLVVDGNDGIVATAGIVEGFIGAGADSQTIAVAAFAAMIAGAISIGTAKYTEGAVERDAFLAAVEEERRQLSLSPEEELNELAGIYEGKGLSPDLARQVAVELSRRDALAAHMDEELDIDPEDLVTSPIVAASASAVAFAAGSLIVLLTVWLTPSGWRIPSTFVAVAISLAITSVFLSRWGNVPVARTILRTVGIGVTAMVITLAIGSQFDL
jgi:VIT1/CCC1 family predicted Fe2+/Mn2+ transporter